MCENKFEFLEGGKNLQGKILIYIESIKINYYYKQGVGNIMKKFILRI